MKTSFVDQFIVHDSDNTTLRAHNRVIIACINALANRHAPPPHCPSGILPIAPGLHVCKSEIFHGLEESIPILIEFGLALVRINLRCLK